MYFDRGNKQVTLIKSNNNGFQLFVLEPPIKQIELMLNLGMSIIQVC
jgi:hypothetical protein